MGWVRKISPYLIFLLIVLTFRPNTVVGGAITPAETQAHAFTTQQEQNQTASTEFVTFNETLTLDGGSSLNVSGQFKHENNTVPLIYLDKRYPLNATITPQSWGSFVDRVHEIRFRIHLMDEGSNTVSLFERQTFVENRELNNSIHTTVFFTIPHEEIPEFGDITSAAILIVIAEGKGSWRVDVETEKVLIQFPLDLIEGPSLTETSPDFALNKFQSVDGTVLRVSGNITVEDSDPALWYYGTLYAISLTIEVLEWGWDARGTVNRIHDMEIALEFIGVGGISVHSLTVPVEPSEIIVVNAPITHSIAYSVSEQDIKGLDEVFFSLYLRFKEELMDRDGKTHHDETYQELTKFPLNLIERSVQEGSAFSKTIKLNKESLVNFEGILNLENATPPHLYFDHRYHLNTNITVLQWGKNVDRLHNIKFIVDIVGGGGAVLKSIELKTTPGEIRELNNQLQTTVFFRVQQESIPTTDNVELAIGISLKEGLENALDEQNREKLAQFTITLEELPSKVSTSPNFTLDIEGRDETILRVTGNISTEVGVTPVWYYGEEYSIQIELEVLKWGWDISGSVQRIRNLQLVLEFIGEGGVSVHSTSTSTDPSEIIVKNSPVLHEFRYSVSRINVNSLNEVCCSLSLDFTEELPDKSEKTFLELTNFPLELKEKPNEQTDIDMLLRYGGFGILIAVIVFFGRKLLQNRQDDWYK